MNDPMLKEIKNLLEQISSYELLQFLADDPDLIGQIQNRILDKALNKHTDKVEPEFYPELTNRPEFVQLLEMVEKTQNVNRSNISAVLAVASRKSVELKDFTDQIMLYFEGNIDAIALFFRSYFEQVKGWKFNKMNRKEGMQGGNSQTMKNWCDLANRIECVDHNAEPVFVQLARFEEQ